MRAVILGAGVVGVTTAYFLAKAGYAVTVVDRSAAPAAETSFANAGQLSASYAAPWAAPGVPFKALGWMVRRYGPLVLRRFPDRSHLRWLTLFLAACTHARYRRNKSRLVVLARESLAALRAIEASVSIAYDHDRRGTLQIFRRAAQRAGMDRDLDILQSLGIPATRLDAAGCIDREPGLAAVADKIVGGIHMPLDETGDCRAFTRALAAHLAASGVVFRMNTVIGPADRRGDRVAAVATEDGPVDGDVFVVALGNGTVPFFAALGHRLPIIPVKGYSLTVPVSERAGAPLSTIMDETYKTALTRLGDHIRVGGTAEIAGFDPTLRPGRRHALEFVLDDLFPGTGPGAPADFWAGHRPMTPDGLPFLGATPLRNVFVNAGHGTLGWTLAAGSGKAVADLIAGQRSPICPDGTAFGRFS